MFLNRLNSHYKAWSYKKQKTKMKAAFTIHSFPVPVQLETLSSFFPKRVWDILNSFWDMSVSSPLFKGQLKFLKV